MSDIEKIRARIATIMEELKAHPETVAEIEVRALRDATMLREASAAMWARKPVPEQRANITPITGANRPRRKPVSDE